MHKINNQLLSTANAQDINTDYCITISTLASRVSWICSVEVSKETRNKITGFEPGQTQSFTHLVFPSSVISHIFACVCELQLRPCVK